ncbi:MAG: hypothetical protein LBP32_03325, partial [Spirochaetaceae bacterium]|nr:hypothetical protein [Spirochaetaceae bacterium]
IAPGIYRGTKTSVSSDAEDLFARYVKERLPEPLEIWVDPQLSFPGDRIFRPDICVVNGKSIAGIFELKMDLGYLRETFAAEAEKRAALLRDLAGKTAHCGIGNEVREAGFAGDLVMNFVSINGSNISRDKLRIVEDAFKTNPPGPLFILSRGKSLDRGSGYTIDMDAFARLEETIAAFRPSGERP